MFMTKQLNFCLLKLNIKTLNYIFMKTYILFYVCVFEMIK